MTNEKSPIKKFFNYILKLWLLWLLMICFAVIFFYGVVAEWFGDMPTFKELENPKAILHLRCIVLTENY